MGNYYTHCIDKNLHEHETGIARLDFVHDKYGELFNVCLSFFSMFLLMCIDARNRYRFQQSDGKAGGTVILPAYFGYLSSVAVVNLVFGLIFLMSYLLDGSFGPWATLPLISLQLGFTHLFYETPTFFFLCNGAGQRDLEESLRGGGSVALAAFGFLFVAGYYGLMEHCYATPFYIFIIFRLMLVLLYVGVVFSPTSVLYQRPALVPYSRFMLLYNVMWSFVNFSLYFGPDYYYCSAYFINFMFDGVFPPLVLYYAFVIDSQYWQGCLPLPSNPMAGIWDVSSEVVSAMATSISQRSVVTQKNIPVIHYGMINIDLQKGVYATGGFSRVYLADYRQRCVAVKLLFAMELTPESIVMFYKEAQILQDLQSEYVVECVGITLMPPAIGVVMEYCQNGSLFDFLYAGSGSAVELSTASSGTGVRATLVGHCADPGPAAARLSVAGPAGIDSFSIDCEAGAEPRARASHTKGSWSLPANRLSALFSSTPAPLHTIRESAGLRNNSCLTNAAEGALTAKYDMMLDAASGLAFMHSKGYMHCDIKSLNYLVTDNLRVKLSDLGEARRITAPQPGHGKGEGAGVGAGCNSDRSESVSVPADSSSLRCPCPAVHWCPPECLAPTRTVDTYTPQSDVFSLSMVLSEVLLHALPLDEVGVQLGYAEWLDMVVSKNQRPVLPGDVPVLLRLVIESGWHTDPSERPGAYEFVKTLKTVIADMKRGTARPPVTS
jgi:hypothetical protein